MTDILLYSNDFNALVAGTELAAADATFSKHTSSANDLIVSNAGRIRVSGASGLSALYYVNSVAPSGYDVDVEADITLVGTISGRTIGIVARLALDTNSCYLVRYDTTAAQWQLVVLDNGSASTLQTAPQTLTLSQAYHVTLSARGQNPTALVVNVDGSDVITGISDSTARTQITGRVGLRGTGSGSNTAGPHVDNYSVTEIVADTPTGASARLWRPSKLKGLVG